MHQLLLNLPLQINTERLVVRCYRAGDGRWYFPMSVRNQAHLARYEAGNPVMRVQCEEDAEIVVREFAAAWVARQAFFFGAFLRPAGEFVAQIYVGAANWELPEFQLGYFADAAHTGQGYVTEAAQAAIHFCFEHLGAQRISLECDDTNTRSSRVAERCGMLREGHMRANKRHPDGTISGTLHYGLLRSDWHHSVGYRYEWDAI